MLAENRKLLIAMLALVGILSAQSVHAAMFHYVATDLTDTTPGEDLWRYDYQVSDMSFLAGYGFSIEFELARYTGLQDPPAQVNGDWSPTVLQPDAFFGDNGVYDAIANVVNASLADLFSLTFVWLGGSGQIPGSQPFIIYDDAFTTIEEGTTVAAKTVPVLAPWALMLLAAPYLWMRRRRACAEPSHARRSDRNGAQPLAQRTVQGSGLLGVRSADQPAGPKWRFGPSDCS